MRGFEVVSKFKNKNVILPTRATNGSAGYDIRIKKDTFTLIKPGETFVFDTGLKAYMLSDEVLLIFIRSSVGIKKHLVLSNCVPVIDSDYYNNSDNEGHIMIAITNIGNTTQEISANERIAQGVFMKFLVTEDDETNAMRVSGIGSTNKVA